MARRTFGREAMAAAVLVVVAGIGSPAGAQEPAPKPAPPEAAKPPARDDLIKKAEEFLKPLPLEPIPDNPPPHEGAMIELSYRVESPDLLLIEVLEALPGRPITGERLIRPDGKISLGFYGEIHVVGLTADQVKVKVILHLRRFLTDQGLGLIGFDETGGAGQEGRRPLDPLPDGRGAVDPIGGFQEMPKLFENVLPPGAGVKGPDAAAVPDDAPLARAKEVRGLYFNRPGVGAPGRNDANDPAHLRVPSHPGEVETSGIALLRAPGRPREIAVPAPALPENGPAEPQGAAMARLAPEGKYVYVDAVNSDRVFVDVAAYNTTVYYVIGDVGKPGRLTCTGKETVLDALWFAGGLLPSADRFGIVLNRPARAGKPAKAYRIDLDAIEGGDKKANLQLFPGDRLVVHSMDGPQPAPRQRR